MDELQIGDKTYISSKQAAKITGYAKDYVGQLCREGRVEARLVGRNWYVLESAVREHRFGKEASEVPEAAGEAAPAVDSTWEKPQYEVESTVFMAGLTVKPAESLARADSSRVLTDMQSAWREWFSERKEAAAPDVADTSGFIVEGEEEAVLEVPEADVATPEPEIEEEAVTLNRIVEEPLEEPAIPVEEEEPVVLHRSYASHHAVEEVGAEEANIVDLTQPAKEGRKAGKKAAKQSHGSRLIYKAMLVSVAGLSILVALIGSGYADRFLSQRVGENGPQAMILNFLGGSSTINNTVE